MMLPLERQNRIKELIYQKKNLKIADLSKTFGVSEMTIHRDVKTLEKEGIITKTFGGISLIHHQPSTNEDCVLCNRKMNERLAYRLILENNTIEMTCCAHCGLLRHRQLGDQVMQAICHDFFKQTTIGAQIAWYVMDTSLHMGCCQPQLLTFEWKEHADKFVKGFGGRVYTFQDASDALFRKMDGAHHCKKEKG
ncbi:DeoR family transcriptional regulator [Virgibacillus salexigens]|nr:MULTISPECIES: DeoR family transcriptional regulator [Virgibacillus]